MSKAKGKAAAVEEAPVVVEIVRGNGEFTLSDGSTYIGDYKIVSDVKVRSGKGTWTFGPERYEGEWENDQMNGHGEYNFSSGAVYRGNFKDNLFNGEGEYIYPDGAFYRGSWSANKMHGKGTYIDAQKMEFNGDFVNGIYSTGSSFRAQKSG